MTAAAASRRAQRVLETDLNTYLKGDWRLVEGTGPYAKLRGKGTFTTVMGGDDFATRTFRETWNGVVDFDDTAPTVAITTVRAQKLRRPAGAYSIRVSPLGSRRKGGNRGRVQDQHPQRRSRGRLEDGETSGTASATLRVRLWKSERRTLRLVSSGPMR